MKTNLQFFNSLQSKNRYLNDGDRVLTAQGTGFVRFDGYGSVVELDGGETAFIDAVVARIPENPST